MLSWRSIVATARRSARAEKHIALLRRNQLFAPLPLTALDRLAEQFVPQSFEPGAVVMRKGDPGDHYLLVEEGELEVSDGGTVLQTCGAGDGVGEIALLERVPRTATVTACGPVTAYAIDADSFLAAIAGPSAAAMAAAVVATRLERSRELEVRADASLGVGPDVRAARDRPRRARAGAIVGG